MLKGGLSLEQIVELLYEDITVVEDESTMEGAHIKNYVEDFEILEKSEIEYKCNCSKEKYFNGLIILGKQEIENILKSDNKIEVECHFCGEKYKFTKQDFEGAF